MVGLADPMSRSPTQSFWVDLASNQTVIGIVDSLVAFGEIAVGAALIKGVATRLAVTLGVLMMLLFWMAAWDFQYGIVNQQFVYMVLSAFVAYAAAVKILSVDAVIEKKTDLVRRRPAPRLVLG